MVDGTPVTIEESFALPASAWEAFRETLKTPALGSLDAYPVADAATANAFEQRAPFVVFDATAAAKLASPLRNLRGPWLYQCGNSVLDGQGNVTALECLKRSYRHAVVLPDVPVTPEFTEALESIKWTMRKDVAGSTTLTREDRLWRFDPTVGGPNGPFALQTWINENHAIETTVRGADGKVQSHTRQSWTGAKDLESSFPCYARFVRETTLYSLPPGAPQPLRDYELAWGKTSADGRDRDFMTCNRATWLTTRRFVSRLDATNAIETSTVAGVATIDWTNPLRPKATGTFTGINEDGNPEGTGNVWERRVDNTPKTVDYDFSFGAFSWPLNQPGALACPDDNSTWPCQPPPPPPAPAPPGPGAGVELGVGGADDATVAADFANDVAGYDSIDQTSTGPTACAEPVDDPYEDSIVLHTVQYPTPCSGPDAGDTSADAGAGSVDAGNDGGFTTP
jgi:hypothetical protein